MGGEWYDAMGSAPSTTRKVFTVATLALVTMALVVVAVQAVLSALSQAIVAFVATPGGLIVLVFVWRWLGRPQVQEARRREWWRG